MYKALPWHDPETYAAAILKQEGDVVFLHSSAQVHPYGTHSYIAFLPAFSSEATTWPEFSFSETESDSFTNAWFGYLSYELLRDMEDSPETEKSFIPLPRSWVMKPNLVLSFNHDLKASGIWYENAQHLSGIPLPVDLPSCPGFTVETLFSNMSKEEYLKHVSRTIDAIHQGDFFQANLTRKFGGSLSTEVNPFLLFCKLCKESPAAYSCYIRQGDTHILSSSPEQFLKIDAKGHVESRPIKGTAPRGKTPEEDLALRAALLQSQKDHSENLMIVDLVRNDLARSCVPGSVKVTQKGDVSELKTLFHLYSTITGQLPENFPRIDLLKKAFPPGSMTGAPKIEVMKHCARLEKIDRGLYSGAIGYCTAQGKADFSVVIRTLILRGRSFEFQVGGGIVSESTPEQEWEETMHKAKGIGLTLGFDPFERLAF